MPEEYRYRILCVALCAYNTSAVFVPLPPTVYFIPNNFHVCFDLTFLSNFLMV